jgi:hypothetical protein
MGTSIDQRRERRFKPNQSATVKVLGLRPGLVIQACILDVSGSGMRLRSTVAIPCGAPIEIEVNNTMSRGTVCRCEPEQDSYDVGVQMLKTAPLSTFLAKATKTS